MPREEWYENEKGNWLYVCDDGCYVVYERATHWEAMCSPHGFADQGFEDAQAAMNYFDFNGVSNLTRDFPWHQAKTKSWVKRDDFITWYVKPGINKYGRPYWKVIRERKYLDPFFSTAEEGKAFVEAEIRSWRRYNSDSLRNS
jgi:hypothetical protein